jgi:hypothetical protein
MERGRYRRSSSCPCWLQRRSLPGSLWGRTAPSRAFKTAAAEEIFRAVSIALKTDLLCLMLGDWMRAEPLRFAKCGDRRRRTEAAEAGWW